MRQKGFTLIEVLVVVAVGGVITLGALLTFYQIILGTGRNNSQVIAVADVNQAALAIRKDLEMTQSVNLTDGDLTPQGSVMLSWTDYTTFDSDNATFHSSNYTLSGTVLRRNYDGVVGIVGRNITYLGFTRTGRLINVVITATGTEIPPKSETLEFSVMIRYEEVEE